MKLQHRLTRRLAHTAIVLGVAALIGPGSALAAPETPVVESEASDDSFIVNGSQSQLTTGEFYVVQNVPPIQLVIPYGPLLIALAVLIVICGLALGIMARIASRPSIGMTLRLNED